MLLIGLLAFILFTERAEGFSTSRIFVNKMPATYSTPLAMGLFDAIKKGFENDSSLSPRQNEGLSKVELIIFIFICNAHAFV